MSREIEFRAWDKTTNKMHYQINKPRTDENMADELIIQFSCTGYSARTEKKYIGGDCLMQWTGLLDKNGKKIFKSDIICWTFDEKTKKEIVFHEGCSGHFNFMGINNEYPEFIPINKKRAENMIVCGNIYQNPELLGGENE
jgi:uncharacterized phage protein (TIGR01671 family)